MKNAVVYCKSTGRIVRYVERSSIDSMTAELDDSVFAVLEVAQYQQPTYPVYKVDLNTLSIVETGWSGEPD